MPRKRLAQLGRRLDRLREPATPRQSEAKPQPWWMEEEQRAEPPPSPNPATDAAPAADEPAPVVSAPPQPAPPEPSPPSRDSPWIPADLKVARTPPTETRPRADVRRWLPDELPGR